jgi:putative transposase
MKQSKFSTSQIVNILKQARAGTPVTHICREHGISNSTFYAWRDKYGDGDISVVNELKALRAENARLKKMSAEEKLKAEIAKDVIAKKW